MYACTHVSVSLRAARACVPVQLNSSLLTLPGAPRYRKLSTDASRGQNWPSEHLRPEISLNLYQWCNKMIHCMLGNMTIPVGTLALPTTYFR
jgi:hypothetical protein